MAQRNRETLRNYFRDGELPTESNFADLVDSMLNMKDEGFRKSVVNGVEISTPVSHDALLSFYRDQSPHDAHWQIRYGGDNNQLQFTAGGGKRDQVPVITLEKPVPAKQDELAEEGGDAGGRKSADAAVASTAARPARVGINNAHPQQALDVGGVVRAQGRAGGFEQIGLPPPPANGGWHDITLPLRGCHAFEVMAGVGLEGSSRYALVHAIAVNTWNPAPRWLDWLFSRKQIRATSAWYSGRCDRIELRWAGGSGKNADYTLQVRSRCDYGDDVTIQIELTQLWSDHTMRKSQK